jgi:hypothetical protein
MNAIASGTVLITGPTGGLGKATTLAIANRPAAQRPDLLLVGRPGTALTEVAEAARAAGATVQEIGCDLARLAHVRDAAGQVKDLLAVGDRGECRRLGGRYHNASADGYELTFAVNHLAHAQLIDDLLDSLVAPARVALLGSNTYHQNIFRRILRAAPAGINVMVFEPGFMPGTGLSRGHGPGLQKIGRVIERIPAVSSPRRSGPLLASIVLDDRWAHLSDGAFVVKDEKRDVKPFAIDPVRESRLWEATAELLDVER